MVDIHATGSDLRLRLSNGHFARPSLTVDPYFVLFLCSLVLAELGDVTRFSSSRRVVRFAGIDVTVSESDGNAVVVICPGTR